MPDRQTLRGLGVALAGGVLLALTGAFNTGEAPLWLRLAYWTFVMFVGAIWGTVASLLAERLVDFDERPWLAAIVLTAVITLPMTGFVWLVTGLIFVREVYPAEAFVHLLGPVALVTATVSVLNVFLGRKPRQTHVSEGVSPAPARFLDRLPARLRGSRLIAVQAEDHYLRLHTDRGSDLILMRLSDAVTELEGLEGAQTHRSWWVARDAVRDVERGDGRALLTLDGGISVPVSRRHAKALRAAGWW
ncbi:MAG TPA: LytTR family DNA-binding domain-containing protein [Brevundimonas sp.]|jgi:hypothetical protein|uniref:LytTR family DNA-binding domain-containing protein n=1 Tax=Brevundimonas sp. TaxID=1871086 RepID=UPI002DEDCB46|nr:LytTR family DNA-binding domain-containing protein [Brevundimonas sp.]